MAHWVKAIAAEPDAWLQSFRIYVLGYQSEHDVLMNHKYFLSCANKSYS